MPEACKDVREAGEGWGRCRLAANTLEPKLTRDFSSATCITSLEHGGHNRGMLAGVVLREPERRAYLPQDNTIYYSLCTGSYFCNSGVGARATRVCSVIHCPTLFKCPTLKALYCRNFPAMFPPDFARLTTLMLHLMDDHLIWQLAHVIRSVQGFTSGRWEAWRCWMGSVGLRRNSNRRHEDSDADGNRTDGTEGIDAQQVYIMI